MHRGSRALILASIIAVSAIVLPIGTLAAPTVSDDSTTAGAIEGHAHAPTATDGAVSSGERVWQGWEIEIDASRIIEGDEQAIEVWQVTDDSQLRQQVGTAESDAEGSVIVETRQLEGRYVLRYDGQPVYLYEGVAYRESPPDGSAVTVASSAFRVERQTLSIEWTDPEVFPGQSTAVTVRSNRERSKVAVSGEGLTFSNLMTIFPESVYANDYDARAASDELLLSIVANRTIRLNTSDLPSGNLRFVVNVVDTTARSQPSLVVNSPASNRRFISVEHREHVGDIIEAELACSSCHLVVGSPEQGVIDVLQLRDGNGDDRVTLRINTRYAGMYTGASGYPSNRRQYSSPDDQVIRYAPGTTLEQVDRELATAVNSPGSLRDRLGLSANGLDRPIDAGRLQLIVASSDFLVPRSAWGDRPPFGSELIVRDETDARTVHLQPRALEGIQPMAAPGGTNFHPTADSLRSEAGPRETAALGDRLVFRIDVSGIYGYLDEVGVSLETLRQNGAEGIDLALHRLGGTVDERIEFDRSGVRFITDPSTDSLYVVLRTDTDRSGSLDEGRYRLTFTLGGVPAGSDSYSTRNAHRGYPFLAPGAQESVSASVRLEPASVAITTPEAGSNPRLTTDGSLTIAGTATVAAGSTLQIEVEATEFAWGTTAQTSVDNQGQWATDLNLTEAPGEEFTVNVIRSDQILADHTYLVRPPVMNGNSEMSPDGEGNATSDGEGPGENTGANNGGLDGPGSGVTGDSLIPGVPNYAIYATGLFATLIVLIVGKLLT